MQYLYVTDWATVTGCHCSCSELEMRKKVVMPVGQTETCIQVF